MFDNNRDTFGIPISETVQLSATTPDQELQPMRAGASISYKPNDARERPMGASLVGLGVSDNVQDVIADNATSE